MAPPIRETDTDGLLGTGYDEQMLVNLLMVTRPRSEIDEIESVGASSYLDLKGRETISADGELGDSLGVSGPYLSDIERNRRSCPPDILHAYTALGKRPKKRKAA